MESAKLRRTIFRRNFSKCSNQLEEELEKGNDVLISALLEKFNKHYEELSNINNTILNIWLEDENHNEHDMNADLDSNEEYENRYYILKHRSVKILNICNTPASSHKDVSVRDSDGSKSNNSNKSRRRYLKLPKFELPTFDGQIKNWIGFWAQFRKINDDNELDNDDKMHYLLQSMEKGSLARDMVESFPPCGENYKKALEHLKERFAKEELIIDHYVRELLQLVTGKNTSKLPISSLYDKIMTRIMALESLGLTQDKYSCFLFPLVESALPDDLIRAWNRSQFCKEKREKPLSMLLQFLRLEVVMS
ncbi:hypothetical protein K1T71_009248 [Dendrolimus kikuchii]|uniref:Uncharacterized protein n=1 Tax=Dendrolimus kikuchii TaxID=765133 RepID=A0ACC1CV23_9NEOP|nr:hypothetical protein K1T71_009248 [Dendrolimus kikuchii]